MQHHPLYRLGLYEKAMPADKSWPELLFAARESGFDFVELSIDETDARLQRLDWTSAERHLLKRQMDDTGIALETMCLSGHRRFPLGSPDPQKRQQGLQIMQKAIDLSLDLGVRIIQLAGYDTYYDPSNADTKACFAENLEKSTLMASQAGVILAFETMETPFMNTVAKAMHYVERIQSPYLQVYPDSGNLTNAAFGEPGDVLADLETGRGHLAALHLKETVPGKFREIPYGTGHVAFEKIIAKALDLGIRRFTSEFWYLGETDWQANLRHAATFLRSRFPDSYPYSLPIPVLKG
jgi:predicted hexulose-6-phosphate isomerase